MVKLVVLLVFGCILVPSIATNAAVRHILWNDNDKEAPLVTGDTIAQARAMEMSEEQGADGGSADAAAHQDAELEAKRKKMINDMLEKYKGGSPVKYLLVGLGMTAFTFVLVYVGEMVWLWQSLNLTSVTDPEIFRKMYPLI
eukprot:CAMPEP_0172184362 /NCGR_PEP_ID=MMETSP1050-20130122/19530_1 /TAXON_ID=233186 /ORGANISM="Cryptomonas curvata, Strain CCAP979/52" /LENGTH=141 /DNA_ID=CAMNT_0012858145 /DNA_START=3 /DNA_END=428 /DNA_ORIENTATION=-